MKKEEILTRSRNEHSDERETKIKADSMKWTYLALVFAAAAFAWFRASQGQPVMDLCATVCLSVFANRTYCYAKLRRAEDLVMAVITCGVCIAATIRFFIGH